MAHKTLINGTEYEISGGKVLIDGTSYDIKEGSTLINGASNSISFIKDVSLTITSGGTSVVDASYAGTYMLYNGTIYTTIQELTVHTNDVIKFYGTSAIYTRGTSYYCLAGVKLNGSVVGSKTGAEYYYCINYVKLYEYTIPSSVSRISVALLNAYFSTASGTTKYMSITTS